MQRAINGGGVAADRMLRQRTVMILSLHRSRERGFKRALLTTEDHLIPAITPHLSLGFGPVYFDWFHRRR